MGKKVRTAGDIEGLRVLPLTEEAFAPFGRVINTEAEGFTPVFTPGNGSAWVVGVNNVVDLEITTLHYHPNTWECFAPVSGDVMIAVAEPGYNPELDADRNLEAIRLFQVVTPMCVAPHVWHALVSSKRGTAFICENANVTGHSVALPRPLAVTLDA